MNTLVICDNSNLAVTSLLSRQYNYGIEIQSLSKPNFLDMNPEGLEFHQKELTNINLRVLHGPFGDLCPGSYDEMVREVAKNRFEYAYDNALKLGATHIVLHHGYVPKTSSYNGWLNRSVAFWQEFLNGKLESVTFHLENLLELDPGLISDVISGTNRKNLDICLDIGHAHCNSKTSVLEWIRHLKGQIGYVHLHDNHGEYDEHLGLGAGNIPLDEVCNALKEYSPNAIWALETDHGDTEKSILWLKERGFFTQI